MTEGSKTSNLLQENFVTHLVALRTHLIRSVVFVAVVFAGLLYFSNDIYLMLSAPLRAQLPPNATMIATDLASGFMARVKLTGFVAFMLSVPYVFWQIWQFVAPALYQKEKRIALPLIAGSIILFYLGMAFAYFITLPAALKFLIAFAPSLVVTMPDVYSYLSFCLKLFVVFGLTFQIPIITLVAILSGLTTTDALASKRRYVIVVCFFISMVVSPPDALSMIILAIPMCLLFEFGLFSARLLSKPSKVLANELTEQP